MNEIRSFVLGGFLGLSGVVYFILFPEPLSLRTASMIAVSIIVSFPLTILLHELGHVLAGRLQGMKLLNLSVGPFVIERHEGRLHFHFVRSALGYLGRAMMGFPQQMEKELMKAKLIRYIYGGPLMNILTGILMIGIAFGIWHHPFWIVFGFVNVLLGMTNLQPTMAKSAMTDGLVIQRLRTVPVEDSIIIAAYSLLVEGMRTANVREWDSDLIEQLERLIASEDPTAKSLLTTLGYYHFPEGSEKVLAIGRTSAFAREESSSDYYADCADITFATALFFNEDLMDYPEIETELSKIGKADVIMDLKRNALLSYIEGDTEKSIDYLNNAKEALGKWHPLYLRGLMERELLEQMIHKMHNRGE